MNVAAFKEFVPGRVMIIVLVLIVFLGAAYLSSVSKRGDHLTRRNFHSLNTIAENIGASVNSLDQVVKFSQSACDEHTVDNAYAECIRKEIGEDGTVLSGGVIRKIELLPCSTESTDTVKKCISSTELDASSPQSFYVKKGQAALKGSVLRKEYHICPSNAPPKVEPQSMCTTLQVDYDILESDQAREGFFDATVIADYAPKKAFAEVISNSASRGLRINSDNIRQLFASRAESNRLRTLQELELSAANRRAQAVTLTPDGVKPIDSSGGKPLPFSQSTVTSIDIGGQSYYAFIQPMDVDLEIENDLVIVGFVKVVRFNQNKYRLPFNLLYVLLLLLLVAGLVVSLVHLAMIGKRELLHRKNTLLANLSLLGLQAITVLIVLQIVSVRDFNDLFRTSNTGIFNAIKADFNLELDERLERLTSIESTLPPSESATQQILKCSFRGNSIRQVTSKTVGEKGSTVKNKYNCEEPSSNSENSAPSAQRLEFTSDHYRGVENIFQLNQSGTQVGNYASNKKKPASLGFKVPSRDYFTRIVNGNNWVYHSVTTEKSKLDGKRFFLTRIESKLDGEKALVISMPASAGLYLEPKIRPAVTVYTTHLQSLRHTVLPAGFGFAVIENISGKVLFHSDDTRSLRENFYQATDDNDLLKARVISAAPSALRLDYKGEVIVAQLGPLKEGVPWTLAVYHHTSVPDVVSFHFGITGGLLGVSHLIIAGTLVAALVAMLGILVTTPGQRGIFRWRKVLQLPQWMCPLRSRIDEYRVLNLCFLAVLPIYLGLVYYIDTLLWFWYFSMPLLAVALWHRLIRRQYYQYSHADGHNVRPRAVIVGSLILLACVFVTGFALVSIFTAGGRLYAAICVLWIAICFGISSWDPIYRNSRRPREGLSVYRRTVSLFGVLAAVLPTLLLLNHNYDIHERLWVHFSSWSTVDHLKARYSGLQRDASKVHFSGSVREYMLNNWRGVYLPRNEILSLHKVESVNGETNSLTAIRHTSDPLLNAGDRSEYYNGYLLARSSEGDYSSNDKIDIQSGVASLEVELEFYDSEKILKDSFSLPRLIAKWSPNLSDMDDMIESFDEKVQNMQSTIINAKATRDTCIVISEPAHLGDCISKKLGKWFFPDELQATGTEFQPRKVSVHTIDRKGQVQDWELPLERGKQIDAIEKSPYYSATYYQEVDDRGGIEYRFLNWYPHTRSLNPFADLLQSLIFTLLVALIFWIFNGWLIRRFFTDAFEVDLYAYPARDLNSPTPMTRGGIIVTPPGTQIGDANFSADCVGRNEYWGELIDLETGDNEYPSQWVLKRSNSSKLVIAGLQCQRMDDEVLSPDLLTFFKGLAEQGTSIIFLCDQDIRYTLMEAHKTNRGVSSGPKLLSSNTCITWNSFISNYKTFYLPYYPLAQANFISELLWHAWGKSSKDEQMALAGLLYEERANPKNKHTLNSLYRRGLILASNYGFRLSRPEMANVIKDNFPLQRYKEERKSYENATWLTWKKPIVVVLVLLMAFVLFVARDQISGVFSIFATVLTGLATIGLISDRIREFSSSLLNRGD